MGDPVSAALIAASVGASAYFTVESGKTQKKIYDRQAQIEKRQASFDALQYKQQGVDALKQLNRVLAANTARAAAGNLDPFSSYDSTNIIANNNLREAVNDFTIARDNASLALKVGRFQAESNRFSGKIAKRDAQRNALIDVAEGGAKIAELGMFDPQTQTQT